MQFHTSAFYNIFYPPTYCLFQHYQLKQIMNSPQHLQPEPHSQRDLIDWLQNYSKTKTIGKNNNIQQQLQSISQSYKNAQEKLLTLEKHLSVETISNEKQRSLIDILKYIVEGNIDDDTIMTYILNLEEEVRGEEENKYSIKEELQQIKMMVDKKKSLKKRGDSIKDGAIHDLKKQIKRLNDVKRELMEDLDSMLNEKDTLEKEIRQLTQKNQQLLQTQKQNRHKVQVLENKVRQLQLLKEKDQQFHKEIKRIFKISENDFYDPLALLQKTQTKLNKYRKTCKQLSQKLGSSTHETKLLSMVKLFMSSEAIKIVQQYEKSPQDCLLRELESVCRLQKNKMLQLANCQQQMWKLRVRSLKDEEGWTDTQKRSKLMSTNIENVEMNSKDVSQFKMLL